jgi:serine/threonine protein kinase/WD40 repeat protein
MATVYLANDRNLGTNVVIKVPRLTLLEESDFARRFDHEIRSLVQLTHPHICRVLDVGVEDGMPFAVLQYLPGGTLEDQQLRDGAGRPKPAPVAQLHLWLKAIAEALDFIHQRGYVHRDVKPSNIMFDEHGYAYLGDFGVAKVVAEQDQRGSKAALTVTGVALGTPQYMASELIMGQPVDGRIDQYALAVTVFEILSGRYPFEGASPTAILVAATTQKSPSLGEMNLGLPPALAQAVSRGLSRDAARRFETCVAFSDAVLATVTDRPIGPFVPGSGTFKTPPSSQVAAADLASSSKIYTCPKCGTRFRVKPSSSTPRAKCPACREIVALNVADPQTQRPMPKGETATMGAFPTAPERSVAPGAEKRAQLVALLRSNQAMFIVGGLLAGVLVAVFLSLLFLHQGTKSDREEASQSVDVAAQTAGEGKDAVTTPRGFGGGRGLGESVPVERRGRGDLPAAGNRRQANDAREEPAIEKRAAMGGFGGMNSPGQLGLQSNGSAPGPIFPANDENLPQGGMGGRGSGMRRAGSLAGGFAPSQKSQTPPEVDKTYEIRRIASRLGPITGFGFALSRDGKFAFTWPRSNENGFQQPQRQGRRNNQLTQWDLESGEQSLLFPGDTRMSGTIVSATLSPDEQFVGICRTVGRDMEVEIWNRRTGKKVFSEAAADVHSLAFLPDNQRFVVDGSRFGAPTTGGHKPSGTTRSPGRGLGGFGNGGIGGSRAGGLGKQSRVLLVNAASSNKLRELTGAGEVRTFAISSDGKAIAAVSDRTIVVWDFNNQSARTFVTEEGTGARLRSDAAPDSKRTGRRGRGARNMDEPKIHNETKPAEILELESNWSGGLAFSADGNRLAAGFNEGVVLVWEMSTGKITRLVASRSDEQSRPIRGIRFVRDDRYIVASDGRSNARTVGVSFRAWNVETGAQTGEAIFADAGSAVGLCRDQSRGIYFDPDGDLCVLDGEKLIAALAK